MTNPAPPAGRGIRMCEAVASFHTHMALSQKQLVEWWRPILKAFDPWRALTLDEIEALYAERQPLAYKQLATDLLIEQQPASLKIILCGARGSGKSTELTRLAHEVREDFCVVHTDLAAGLPEDAGTLAVVTLLGVAALHAIESWADPDKLSNNVEVRSGNRLQAALDQFGEAAPNVKTLLEGISGIATFFNPAVGAALAAGSAAIEAGGAIANAGTQVRHGLARGPLARRLAPEKRDDAKAVVDAVNEILVELQALAGRPPLLLADGLDKRTGVHEVELALSDEYLLRELQAPLVLTGPVNLRHDPRFRRAPGNFRLALLYNVPVCERDRDGNVTPSESGPAVLLDLYAKRHAAAKLPEALCSAEIVERAALMSAGIVREFLGLLHSACKHAIGESRQTISFVDIEAAIKARRLELEGYLNERHLGILARVLAKGTLPASADADTLLFENFIACYPNGDIWFRPHELIVNFVEDQEID